MITIKASDITISHRLDPMYNNSDMMYIRMHADATRGTRYTGSLKTTGKFKSFKYQNYSPRVISTRFLDARGREISGKIGKGQIINVETKVANGGDYSFPAHLKLDKSLVNKIDPLPWKEQGAIQDGKPISVTEEENMNTYKGLPISVKPMGSNKKGCAVITYKAKITGDLYVPGGEDVSVIGQIVTDDYFQTIKEEYADAGTIPYA